MTFFLEVPGEVVAQSRPRFKRMKDFVTTYDPKRSKDYKQIVADTFKKKYPDAEPIEGGIWFGLTVFMPIPKSYPKWKKKLALKNELFPAKRPDIDNYFKSVTDALIGLAYKDDKQIVSSTMAKRYGMSPKAIIFIKDSSMIQGRGFQCQ